MDFEEFEQLVLKLLFETEVPVTAAHTAYLGRLSVRGAERHLARMVEQGTLLVRTSPEGVVEYYYPGRQPLARRIQPQASPARPRSSLATRCCSRCAATTARPPPCSCRC